MHSYGLADDEAIADEFADGLAGVGIGDLVDFVRIEPDLAFATADDGCRQALLSSKVDPGVRIWLAMPLIESGKDQSVMTRCWYLLMAL